MNEASPAIEAEAAAWITRLKGPNRTLAVEKGFRRWLNLSPQHAQAFEIATETWEKLALLKRRSVERAAHWEQHGVRLSLTRVALATAAVVILTALATSYYSADKAIETAVGEQRTLSLEDGTRVALNTATRLKVQYDKNLRHIELQNGEALFHVAVDKDRPFVVLAGEREIKALGTSFVVRRNERDLAVTLIDGAVSVAPVAGGSSAAAGQVLKPGQRLIFRESQPANLDAPVLDKVTAWQRGQVAFDNTPLEAALAEMNRYSRVKLVAEDPAAARVRISGLFRVTESSEFAQAIARTYSLAATEQSGKIILRGVPQIPNAR
jgi:transmembrane sensor